MSKLLQVCKKCGWKHGEFQDCLGDDGRPLVKKVVPVVAKPPVVSGDADLLKSLLARDEARRAARREYMAKRRRSAKWALARILEMGDVSEIHALARSVLNDPE